MSQIARWRHTAATTSIILMGVGLRRGFRSLVLAVGLSIVSVGCSEEDPAGPDVTGYTLPEAKKTLKQAGINPMIESDAVFGVIVEENFTVCEVHAVNENAVRLTVDNDSCQ